MAGIIQDTAYGLSQPILAVDPRPIISLRNPTVRDKAQLGQMWINKTTGIVFFLGRIANNQWIWSQGASVVAALAVAGAATIGTTLQVTGLSTLIGGATLNAALTVTVGGAAITGNSTVTGTFGVTGVTTFTGASHVVGAMDATTTITAGTGLRATAGGMVATGVSSVTGTFGVTGVTTFTGASHVVGAMDATTTITAGTGLRATTGGVTATLGDITATNGNLILSTATTGITLPGPTRIITGAGVPNAALGINVGDIYINTTAATAVTRIYVCTVALTTWANITCSA